MSAPAEPRCQRNAPRLGPDEAAGALNATPFWRLEEDRLVRDFLCEGFDQTVRMVNAVCDIARREDHHPRITFVYKQVRVEYWTHTAGGVTMNDFICAKHINLWMEKNT